MSDLSMTSIGKKIKDFRIKNSLTLDQVSKLTNVSKTMLGQIERNESVPTIRILWKIASGLKITMTDLLTNGVEPTEQPLDILTTNTVYEADGEVELHVVFPFDPITGFEYLYIKMNPESEYFSVAHKNAVGEYIVITQGSMNIILKDQTFTLNAPCAFRFFPNVDHIYSNPSQEEVIFQDIVKY